MVQPRPPHRWLQRRQRQPREPPGSGAESRLRRKNKQLKMAATAAASPAPHRHRPADSAAAHIAGLYHLRRKTGGRLEEGAVFMVLRVKKKRKEHEMKVNT